MAYPLCETYVAKACNTKCNVNFSQRFSQNFLQIATIFPMDLGIILKKGPLNGTSGKSN